MWVMITKELTNNKICLFCASDYHLEMILLPYIKNKIDDSRFVILTQENLEESMKILLKKINIDESIKEKIWNLKWNVKEFDDVKDLLTKEKNNTIIINGNYKYIKEINRQIKDIEKINIIDCYHIEDKDVDIELLSKSYETILNTRKI